MNAIIEANGMSFTGEELASIYANAYISGIEYIEITCESVSFDEWWHTDQIKEVLKWDV